MAQRSLCSNRPLGTQLGGVQSSVAPARHGTAGLQRRRQQAGAPCAKLGAAKGTASGLEISGLRPTSPKAWEVISTTLKKSGIKLVAPQEATSAAARGVSIIDVRPADEYKEGRLPGSTNVPFYRSISGWGPTKVLRRAAFLFFGVKGTEYNPDFISEVAAAAAKGKGVVLVCNIGGSLDPTGPSKFGQQSRSLTAAYELVQAGFKSVQVLKGGYFGWAKAEREVEMDA